MRMTRNTFHFIICTLLSLTVSCTNGDISELLRSYDDPFDETPAIDCYSSPYTVRLSWQEDECADKFILLRAADNGLYTFTEIYRGLETTYEDNFSGMESCDRYLYRLDKTRGSRTFTGSTYAYAVSSISGNDSHENNNEPTSATELEISISATMPCSRFFWRGTVSYDVDWYYVYVPAQRTATILLEQTDSSTNTASADTDFIWMEEGGTWEYVANSTPFKVINRDLKGRIIRFRISPNIGQIFPSTAGTRVLSYSLTLQGLE